MANQSSEVEALTGREADVLACLADGLSNNEIAERLFLSLSTVKWYVRQLNRKLDTTNRDEIVQRARSLGLF
jgi:ATP/maltotriose-dependent transcriptional regulator MalT